MVSWSFINGIFTFVFISLSHFGFNYFTKVNKPIELIAFASTKKKGIPVFIGSLIVNVVEETKKRIYIYILFLLHFFSILYSCTLFNSSRGREKQGQSVKFE